MEIKVGEYVRSHLGDIGKVTRIENNSTTQFLYEDETLITIDRNVVKHSPNIIDLIEIGDYVNGNKVRCFKKENCDYDIGFDYNDDYGEYFGIDAEDIKTIVTHEQFDGMEYKV